MPRAEFGSDFDNGVHAIRGQPSSYFPLATMLTFTSAVGKLNIRVLGQHHTLLQVISRSYCQVFVKSYNFVFEKINIQYAPYQKLQKTRSSAYQYATCFVKNPPENCVSA